MATLTPWLFFIGGVVVGAIGLIIRISRPRIALLVAADLLEYKDRLSQSRGYASGFWLDCTHPETGEPIRLNLPTTVLIRALRQPAVRRLRDGS